jgi:vacuolar-type H+-ATPase subunit B/Vma2
MVEKFAVVFSGELAKYFGPSYFDSEIEAEAYLERAQAKLKDPSEVKLVRHLSLHS